MRLSPHFTKRSGKYYRNDFIIEKGGQTDLKKLAEVIIKNPVVTMIIAVILLLPCIYGYIMTPVNYDILTYLPKDLDSTKGQELLNTTFNDAATSMLIVENMQSKDVVKLKNKIENINGVDSVIWTDDAVDISVPKEMLPDDAKDMFYSGNTTTMIVKYKNPASSAETIKAVGDIRKVLNKQCFLSGMSAIITDTKNLADKEAPFYITLAVILSLIAMLLTMESTFEPFIFLIGVSFAVMYNLGTNIFMKEISYITKCIAGVLQLGVTMDYSIFLLDRYDEEKQKYSDRREAMAQAIQKAFTALWASSLTTIASFLALCFMKLSIGKDIGLVMAKGVIIGILCAVTVLPALVLIFDKPLHKYKHKVIMPQFKKLTDLLVNKYKIFAVIFILAFLPAIYSQSQTKVYYTLDESIPRDLDSIVATNKLKNDYNMATTHFIIVKDNIKPYKLEEMVKEIEKVDGVNRVLAYDKFVGPMIPEDFIPQKIKDIFKKDGYQLIIANSKYKAARDEENAQIEDITRIVKSYDKGAMVAGEGPLTKDLIETTDNDIKVTNYLSAAAFFAIVACVFKSVSVPVILILAIGLAIFINMGIPFFTGTSIPFIASIVIGCIQLGATDDYAILMVSRFEEELLNGHDKFEAMRIAARTSDKSIITSALVFFCSTAGVALVSKIEIIKTLCAMLARGSLISAAVIILLFPSLLLIFESAISKTTHGWKKNVQA